MEYKDQTKMKKKISTIFAFLMIVVLVAGCAAPTTPQAEEPTQAPGNHGPSGWEPTQALTTGPRKN